MLNTRGIVSPESGTKPYVEEEELFSFLPYEATAVDGPAQRPVVLLRHRRPERPWMISTCVLAALLVLSLLIQVPSHTTSLGSPEIPSTELQALLPAVEYELQQYTGILTYNETSGTAVRVRDGEIDFFGPPSDEVDSRWDILLHDEFPAMMEDEIPAALPDSNRFPDGHFHFEPDFFHNLHCLNEVRKEVSKVLYPGVAPLPQLQHRRDPVATRDLEWAVDHIEHCMDRIRQALMCHADLTPSIMHRWEGFSLALGQTGPRKCRKWQPIRQWINKRNAAFDDQGGSAP